MGLMNRNQTFLSRSFAFIKWTDVPRRVCVWVCVSYLLFCTLVSDVDKLNFWLSKLSATECFKYVRVRWWCCTSKNGLCTENPTECQIPDGIITADLIECMYFWVLAIRYFMLITFIANNGVADWNFTAFWFTHNSVHDGIVLSNGRHIGIQSRNSLSSPDGNAKLFMQTERCQVTRFILYRRIESFHYNLKRASTKRRTH